MPIYALGDQVPVIDPTAFISPDAVIIGSVTIGANSSIWSGAVLRGDDGAIVIGERTSIQDGTVIHTTPANHTTVGDDCVIGHIVHLEGCIIENGASIGAHSQLESNVTIGQNCSMGQHCHIYAGAVLGSDGFGYAHESNAWLKIPQLGRVRLGNHVDVGANTTIDRGALDDTVIEDGVKLDNLIQVGHNCRIGAHTAIAACVAIAGSTNIGKHCKIGGAAMILGHLEIVDGVTVSPGSMITRSLLKQDTYTAIMPFQSHQDWLNNAAQIRHLDKMAKKIKNLEKQLALLKSR